MERERSRAGWVTGASGRCSELVIVDLRPEGKGGLRSGKEVWRYKRCQGPETDNPW